MKKYICLIICAALVSASCSHVMDDFKKDSSGNQTPYTVEHYQQNISDDDYTLVTADTQNLTGTTGAQTAAAAKSYTGFTAGTVTQSAIAADGSTVVKLYYSRNIITLTFDLAGGTTSTTFTSTTSTGGTLSGKYGAAVSIENPTKTGYSFSAWNPAVPSVFPAENTTYTATYTLAGDYNITYNLDGGTNVAANPASYNIETETITLADATKTGYTFGGWYSDSGFTAAVTQIAKGSTGAVTLYAKWSPATDTSYTVEHWQQNISDDDYTLVTADTQNLTGTTGAQTAAAAKTYTGFTAQTVAQSAIAADGSTVVKLYYSRNIITLTFDLAGGTTSTTFTATTSSGGTLSGKYGAAVSIADPTWAGYTFAGWSSTVQTTFSADASYTASWKTKNTMTLSLISGDVSVSVSGSTYTATPPTGTYTYKWYFNGSVQLSATSTCTIDTTGLTSGYYELVVTATDTEGVIRSARYTVTVE